MHRFYILLFLLSCGSTSAQPALNYVEAIEDVEVAISALEECHPGLDIHLSEKSHNGVYANWKDIPKAGLGLNFFFQESLKSQMAIPTFLKVNDFNRKCPITKIFYHSNTR